MNAAMKGTIEGFYRIEGSQYYEGEYCEICGRWIINAVLVRDEQGVPHTVGKSCAAKVGDPDYAEKITAAHLKQQQYYQRRAKRPSYQPARCIGSSLRRRLRICALKEVYDFGSR